MLCNIGDVVMYKIFCLWNLTLKMMMIEMEIKYNSVDIAILILNEHRLLVLINMFLCLILAFWTLSVVTAKHFIGWMND